METKELTAITIETVVNAPVEKVWKYWSSPEHITQWCAAADDWHAPYADNDLREDGKFRTTMAAKDGSFSFEFEGVYTRVKEHRLIEYTMPDGRNVSTVFSEEGNKTRIIETFDPESQNPIEMQRTGWQAILDNFKKYVEEN